MKGGSPRRRGPLQMPKGVKGANTVPGQTAGVHGHLGQSWQAGSGGLISRDKRPKRQVGLEKLSWKQLGPGQVCRTHRWRQVSGRRLGCGLKTQEGSPG